VPRRRPIAAAPQFEESLGGPPLSGGQRARRIRLCGRVWGTGAAIALHDVHYADVHAVVRLLLTLTGLATGYLLAVRGSLTIDLGIGRRIRPLGPMSTQIAASPETVFDVISAPYLGRTPRAMQDELQVLERGSDLAVAAHFTRVGRLTAATVEAVRFERPSRVAFRLVRGPVPHVVESFDLRPTDGMTSLEYRGELGTDLWRLGQWWGDRVAAQWERAVDRSLERIRSESERRAGKRQQASST
jgi:hypothetical protein